ncbi:MAG: hypothetical protein D8M57_13240 [Candidatus Scalindua sp. AMX11]|nr:MAG: hypothetical protein DWQ00_11850 [Candidatus Scalindua sp.]NOG83760.1 hypothetical protein [Planctomycetota bacterium]RZV82919.1 MAG: hypothetical protein EX341_09005 [Candidatus Scalindua sp. SCAELEC01]TDE64459.1 MAG: hypothetical protein D8M57_13240 [Candidatus Scalindua sp. AMX11]GJQ59788.1 MAG: hypothetical protein SCALA701_25890 [Candidatus Scalindua sp.]
MKKLLLFLIVMICFSGCATTVQQSFIVKPVKFDQGITDKQILSYAGDLKIMCSDIIYGGTALRYASTTVGRGSGIMSGLLGVSGNAGRGTLGVLSILSGAAYESQSIFDAKGKAAICVYGLRRIEKAELKYARGLLKAEEAKEETIGDGLTLRVNVTRPTTEAGLDLYSTVLKTKEVMLKMLMGQVPEKGEL